MTARVLDGKMVASLVKAEVAERVAGLSFQPGLATVLVGDDPASHAYVRGKRADAAEVGIRSVHHELGSDTSLQAVLELIASLNADDGVDGILVQLPLPGHLDSDEIVEAIDPAKDVDGLHPWNLGRLVLGQPGLRPCTPTGVLRLMEEYDIEASGQKAMVIGRSILVGRPLALMLSTRGVDATVTVAHSRTEGLIEQTREADILVAAMGVPKMITADHVKTGATVIDVGISRVDGALVGDVDYESVSAVAGAITPVPGGVGPMTRAMLLVNTIDAAARRRGRAG